MASRIIPDWRLSLSLIFACLMFSRLDAVTPKPSDDRYLPLAQGMEWVMDAHIVTPDKIEFKGKGVRRVGAPVEREGKEYLVTETSVEVPGLPKQTYTKLMRTDAGGIYSIMMGIENAQEEVEIPLPLKIGTTWETEQPRPLKHTIVAMENVKIGEKVYRDCFKIRSEGKEHDFIEEFWEAPMIGCVKSEIQTGGTKITLTLRSFKPGK